jgi:hypothetical protein
MKTVPVGVETFIDVTTGEVAGQKVITRDVLVKDSEEWFSGFRKLVRALLDLDGNEVKVLLWCAINATVGTNEIVLARLIKERMAVEIGLSMGGIDNALGRLVRKHHLHRLGRGMYHIDPATTWRGDLKSRAKSIQIYLNYTVEQP